MALPAGDRELIQIVDAAFADAARRAGPHLACRPVCTQCCYGAFSINALDAARLRAGIEILRAADPGTAEAIQQRARAWVADHGAAFPGDATTGVLGSSPEERARFDAFANEASCPALDLATGRCDVYAWRPMTCRVFGPPVRTTDEDGNEGLGHCELCFTSATAAEISAGEMSVPHEAEEALLTEVGDSSETVVAFALLP